MTRKGMVLKRIVLILLLVGGGGAGIVWAGFHFGGLRWQAPSETTIVLDRFGLPNTNHLSWAEAVEKVKAARTDPAENVALEIPPELKHYPYRHWFLATQVAEVNKHNVLTCQDFLDLAAMIRRGEIVSLPAVTDTYVLYGVGQRADDDAFGKYLDGADIALYSEADLDAAYKRLADRRSALQKEINSLNAQAGQLKKRDRARQRELQIQLTARQQELSKADEQKKLLDQFYGNPDSRRKLLADFDSLRTLAQNFAGRSFDIERPDERRALKVSMLSSLRPEALKILQEIAAAYHQQFDRPLPVSSLVRPEQYQHALRRVNRNAILIETPPHSTGLAFDIDYRYMSAAEQNFLMAELARLKLEGRIEVIRERTANFHVFAFMTGTRPSDDLIEASLDAASVEGQEAHHAGKEPKAARDSKKHRIERQRSRRK